MKNVMQDGRNITLKIICTFHDEWIGKLSDQHGVFCTIVGLASPQAVEKAALDGHLDFDRIEVVPSRLQDEINTLDKANAGLAAGRIRIERQAGLLRKLKDGGHDTSMASEVLVTLEGTQRAMLDHRQAIIAQIDRLNQADEDAQARTAGARLK